MTHRAGKASARATRGSWGILAATALVPGSSPAPALELDQIASVSGFQVNAVDVQGNRAYTVGRHLHVLDITDRTQPRDLGQAGLGTFSGADVQVVGNHAFIAANGAGLLVFDVSKPEIPTQVARVPLANANTVHVVGTLACVAAGPDGVRLVDVSNPRAPVLKGGHKVPAPSSPSTGATWAGDWVYSASGRSGLAILDADNPTTPNMVTLHPTPKPSLDVKVQGSLAYVAMADTGMAVIDVTRPEGMANLGFAAAPDARRVELARGFAWVADGRFGMRVFDVANPTSPREVSQVGTESLALDVRVENELVYLSAYNAGMRVYQIVTPPVLAAHPADQTVTEGASAIFEAHATGSPAPTLQWQVSADQGDTWRNLEDDANLQGTASGRLTVGKADTAWSGLKFRVIASNKKGSVASVAGTLTVEPRPVAPIVELGPLQMLAAFTISGEVGASYRVEYTEVIGSAEWQAGETVTLQQETQLWVDRSKPVGGSRIYRAVRVP